MSSLEAKLQVELCAEKVTLCKSIYADAMSRLERISVSVHDHRRRQTMTSTQSSSPPSSVRGQGVGADSTESIVELAHPERDVFSSSPRLNEKSIFPTDSPLNRLKLDPNISADSKFHPFVNGLLQHVHAAAAQLAVCDESIRLSSPSMGTVSHSPYATPNSVHPRARVTSQTLSDFSTRTANVSSDDRASTSYETSTVKPCRDHSFSHMNSSFGAVWDCLSDPHDLPQDILSSVASYSTLYMKRAHSSSAIPTSCLQ
ncbi:unnamed protein product [Echinostoma caproni]|uniref:TBD domain-containing protein n=1 Tax=Echinostoma caproni TaxID=27848 RepID=A0A183AIR9_9TREM|nr:unnamed protein product [Echinostoma caproni]